MPRKDYYLAVSANKPKAFDLSIPDAHVFVNIDKPILVAFMDVGAVPRLLGNKPMMPGINVLARYIGRLSHPYPGTRTILDVIKDFRLLNFQ